MSAIRIVIAGEIYSQNLGDGVIYECLRFLFQRHLPRVEIIPLDISGRNGWVELSVQQTLRLKALSQVRYKAAAIYTMLNLIHLKRLHQRRLHKEWASLIRDADLIVIGGGKLLMDNHLDFPFKLSRIAKLASAFSKPVHFTSCGVGATWSPTAKRMLDRALADASTITVRDQTSQSNLTKNFPAVSSSVAFDPAIWAGEVYRCTSALFDNLIGLGLINPADVNLFLPPEQRLSTQELVEIYYHLINALNQKGMSCELFTNGSANDASFARYLASKLENCNFPQPRSAPHPQTPSQLVNRISQYGGVIACRLHANLVALACRKPTLGLSWDDKINALYEQLERSQDCQPITHVEYAYLADRLATLLANRADRADIEPFKEAISSNVALILETVND